MTKPVCVQCQRFFRPKKNGVSLVEAAPRDNDAIPGTDDPDSWRPYKLWQADLWECRGCGVEIVVGFGEIPLLHSHETDFAESIERRRPLLQVNDC